MTDEEFEYCEEMEKRKHDEKLKELKDVQLLSQHILDLQKDKGKLIDENKELNKQIEKMKNCRNCKNEKIEGVCGHFTQVGWCKNWELAN